MPLLHATPQVRNIEYASALYNAFTTIPMIALMAYATISLNERSEEIGEQSVRLLASSGLAAPPADEQSAEQSTEHAGNEHAGNEPGSGKAGGDGASDLEACTGGGGGGGGDAAARAALHAANAIKFAALLEARPCELLLAGRRLTVEDVVGSAALIGAVVVLNVLGLADYLGG